MNHGFDPFQAKDVRDKDKLAVQTCSTTSSNIIRTMKRVELSCGVDYYHQKGVLNEKQRRPLNVGAERLVAPVSL